MKVITLYCAPDLYFKELIMLLKALRNGLGLIIVFIDKLTRPKPIMRSDEDQKIAQAAVQGISLYQQLNVAIESRDINRNPMHRENLEAGGGRVKVPCLRIEKGDDVEWMYESDDIINFLKMRLA